MANISQELAAIMAAVFGRDVRQSIHDAIDKVNKVSETQMNAGTEINSPTSPTTDGSGNILYYDGSLYINIDNYELWKCTGIDSWVSLGIFRGIDGRSIASITGPTSVGLQDTYTINFSDGTTSSFVITNGADGADGIDGSQWYKTTALTGNGSGITGFPGKINDFAINPSGDYAGYVYRCTKTGGSIAPDAAEWEFVMLLASSGSGSIAVFDNLTSTSAYDALSANQGRNLDNKKIEKPLNPNPGQILGFEDDEWKAIDPPKGYEMLPDPTSTEPLTPEQQELAIVNAIKAGILEGWENDNVASLNSVGHWSNTMSKTFTISGIAGANTPIGTTGVGTWYDGEPGDIDPSTDEADWISIPLLIGLGSNSDVDIKLVFDPLTSSIPIVLGGYIIDDVTGKMCIKFANEITDDDTHTAVIGVEVIFKRTETVPVSIS